MRRNLLLILFITQISILFGSVTQKIKVGVYENYPKIYTSENGEVRGFWSDIITYISEKENWEIEWIPGTWKDCLSRLEQNEIDLMVDVCVTEAREELFLFSDEVVYLSWSWIYV
jgi:ABC-type amino acid transport substrate-binding protein